MGSDEYGDTTIVLPTFNEAETLPSLLPRLLEELPGVHVVVSDDGSDDGTQDVVRRASAAEPRVRLLDRTGRDRGLTAAVADAILTVTTEHVVVMDADGQHPVEAVPRLVEALRTDAPIAVGTRDDLAGLSGPRKAVSAGAAAMTRAYLWATGSCRTRDVMSGFFGARSALAVDLVRAHGDNFERGGYKVLLDLLKVAPRDTEVAEVPYEFQPRMAGESKIGMTHVRALLRQLGPLGRFGAVLLSERVFRFALVGGSGIAVNLAVFAALLQIELLHLAVASAVAVEVAILWNFALNRRWTWGDRPGALLPGLTRFHAVSFAAMALNVAVLLLLVQAGSGPLPAQFAGILLASGANFAGNHLWTFNATGRGLPTRVRWYAAAVGLYAVLAVCFADPRAMFEAATSVGQVVDGTPGTGLGPVSLALLTPVLAPLIGAGAGPALLRLGTKLPVILALVIAAVAARDIVRTQGRKEFGDIVERLVLFNPVALIVVAMGALEALTLAALLGAVALVARGRHHLAGATLAAGILTGPTALAAVPAIAAWARRRNGTPAMRHVLASAGVLTGLGLVAWVVAVPFDRLADAALAFASSGPAGFSWTRIVEYPDWFAWVGVAVPAVPLVVVRIVSFSAAALVVLGATSLAARDGSSRAVLFALAALTTGLAATLPVAGPPDLLMPLAMGATLGTLAVPAQGIDAPIARRVFVVASGLVAGAAVLNGGRAVLLVPPDVALSLFGTTTDLALAGVGNAMGVSRAVTGLVLGAAATVMYGVALVWLLRAFGPALVDAHPIPLQRIKAPLRPTSRRVLATAVGFALLVTPAAAASLFLDAANDDGGLGLPDGTSGDPGLALLVRTNWENPASDPSVRYGPWLDARTTPVVGFYETDDESLTRALWGAHAMGAGTVALEAVPWNYDGFATGASLADRAGFNVVPVVDVRALVADTDRSGPGATPRTNDDLAEAIDGTLRRVGATLDGLDAADDADGSRLVLLRGAGGVARGPIAPTEFWDARLSFAAERGLGLVGIGPSHIRSAPSPEALSVEAWSDLTERANSGVAYVQVPLDDAGWAVDAQRLQDLLEASPADTLVVVDSWNDHRDGRVIEPTAELGRAALDAVGSTS